MLADHQFVDACPGAQRVSQLLHDDRAAADHVHPALVHRTQRRALVMRPRLLLLDEPTEGIQPSIIKDIGRAITHLRQLGQMAIVLVEQYLDFARELGDRFAVMDRGTIVYACERTNVDEQALRRAMAL